MTTVEINENPDATGTAAAAADAAVTAAAALETIAAVALAEATQVVVDEAVSEALTLERLEQRISDNSQDMWRRLNEMDGKIEAIAAATVASQQVVQAVAAEVEAVLDAPAEPEAEATEETPPAATEAPVKKSKWV